MVRSFYATATCSCLLFNCYSVVMPRLPTNSARQRHGSGILHLCRTHPHNEDRSLPPHRSLTVLPMTDHTRELGVGVAVEHDLVFPRNLADLVLGVFVTIVLGCLPLRWGLGLCRFAARNHHDNRNEATHNCTGLPRQNFPPSEPQFEGVIEIDRTELVVTVDLVSCLGHGARNSHILGELDRSLWDLSLAP